MCLYLGSLSLWGLWDIGKEIPRWQLDTEVWGSVAWFQIGIWEWSVSEWYSKPRGRSACARRVCGARREGTEGVPSIEGMSGRGAAL